MKKRQIAVLDDYQNTTLESADLFVFITGSVLTKVVWHSFRSPCNEMGEPAVRGRLRLFESHLLCDKVVEHPHREESEQSPVLETLRNDRVACLRFCRAECQMDGLPQTLRG